MSGARLKYLARVGGIRYGPKQAQLITMHRQDFSDKGRVIKGLVVYRVNGRFIPKLRCGLFFKVRGKVNFNTDKIKSNVFDTIESYLTL